ARREEATHAFDGRLEPLESARVGEAEIAGARGAERRPGQGRHPSLVEEAPTELVRGKPRTRNVREGVEGAARADARDAGERVERVDQEVPPATELGDHLLDGLPWSADRGDRAVLPEGAGAGDDVDVVELEGREELRRNDAPAETPARHRPGLREAVDDDRAIEHAGQGCDARERLVVGEVEVDLIREDVEAAAARLRCDGLEVRARQDAAGRVLGRVQDHEARPVAYE